jgi:hypothetical protein
MPVRRQTVEHPFGDKVVDGIDALPDENAQARQRRNGAARSGLQHETGDAHSGRWRIDGGDPHVRPAASSFRSEILTDIASPSARMGGAKRYPSIASYGDDGFHRLNPSHILRTGIGRDDLIDACVCAVAARDSASRLGGDEVDINGLQMQINC